MRLLVTGGMGYVGSHFVWAAHERGEEVVVLDDCSGSSRSAPLPPGVPLVLADVTSISPFVHEETGGLPFDAVVHFAGKQSVGESVRNPRLYFETNLVRSLKLLENALEAGVRRFVASSTCAVYGDAESPIKEDARKDPVSAYGASKLAFEHALRSYGDAYGLRWAAPRYFNAAGAQRDGFLFEAHEPQTHLLPLAVDAALGLRPPLTVFGSDYETPDGTAIRDYVHVSDIVSAHLLALDYLADGRTLGAFNLGTGEGRSVLEILSAVERVTGASVPRELGARRAGDPERLVADPSLARGLGWVPERSDLRTIVEDAVRSRTRAYGR